MEGGKNSTGNGLFSTQVFEEVQPILRRIIEHPFNRELATGMLSRERFCEYMVATSALENAAEVLAARLPCFWIYREVGRHIAQNSALPNPCAKWIEAYPTKISLQPWTVSRRWSMRWRWSRQDAVHARMKKVS